MVFKTVFYVGFWGTSSPWGSTARLGVFLFKWSADDVLRKSAFTKVAYKSLILLKGMSRFSGGCIPLMNVGRTSLFSQSEDHLPDNSYPPWVNQGASHSLIHLFLRSEIPKCHWNAYVEMLSLYHVSRYSPLKMNGWNWNPTSTLADFHPSLGAWLSSEADQLHSTALRFLVPGQNPSGKRAIKKTHQVSKFWRLARTKIVYIILDYILLFI